MRKLINDPRKVAAEAIEGLALAYPQYLRLVAGAQAVVRKDAPIAGKVAVLSGGGSGHEPMFAGFVGAGMADGSVAGNIFASPPPRPIAAAAQAVHGGAGALLIYGNYSGDVLNFEKAAEMMDEEGIRSSTVRVTDDVASAPPERHKERRGIAGDFFVIKVAGACAGQQATLAEVTAAAEEANRNTRRMGVTLSSCIIPASGKRIFDLADGDMEVGMGLIGFTEPLTDRRLYVFDPGESRLHVETVYDPREEHPALPAMDRVSEGPAAENAHRVGANDPLILPAAAEFVKQIVPTADLRYFDGAHFVLDEYAEPIAEAIIETFCR